MTRRILTLVGTLALLLALLLPVGAAYENHPPRLVDNGDLLTESQEESLTAQLDLISDRHEMDIVIVTETTLNGTSPRVYADDYFDYGGYGYNGTEDGVLLLLCPSESVRYISTCGAAIDPIDEAFDDLTSAILSNINRGDYFNACKAYVDGCDEIFEAEGRFPVGLLLIAIVIGAVLSFLIPMKSLKGQLKSVRHQAEAKNYVRPGSMELTRQQDIFLYRNVTKRARPKNNGGSGGRHTSSSGRSHGGGSF